MDLFLFNSWDDNLGSLEVLLKTDGTPVTALAASGTGVISNTAAIQDITEGATITADACMGVKNVTATGTVTPSTSNTFTNCAAIRVGCVMHVVNTSAGTINLDETMAASWMYNGIAASESEVATAIAETGIGFTLYLDQARSFIQYIDQARGITSYIDQAGNFDLEL